MPNVCSTVSVGESGYDTYTVFLYMLKAMESTRKGKCKHITSTKHFLDMYPYTIHDA